MIRRMFFKALGCLPFLAAAKPVSTDQITVGGVPIHWNPPLPNSESRDYGIDFWIEKGDKPQVSDGDPICRAIGEASMCWEHVERAGVFNSDLAVEIAERLSNEVKTPDFALKSLKGAMDNDPHFAWTWYCNIAMPLRDAGVDRETANSAAERLMSHLFGQKLENYDPGV